MRMLDELSYIEASWIGKIMAVEDLIKTMSDYSVPSSIYSEIKPCLNHLKATRDKIQNEYDYNGTGAAKDE
jgi:hypothetical protein